MSAKIRIDQLLVAKGLCSSRENAQRAVMAGRVFANGQRVAKSSQQFPPTCDVDVVGSERFVGRGAYKLEAAIEHFQINVAGRVCLDIGASTGGFTDCLLQRGAARVHAIDVGRGQLDWCLRKDARVIVREGVNARHLTLADLGERVSLAVADVSFISLTLILPPAFALLHDAADMVALIKPQFELSPAQVGRGGVVRDAGLRREAVEKIRSFAGLHGWKWKGVIESPLTGREGNIEFLAHLMP